MEEDLAGGCSPPLPELTEEEWALLVNAPAFRMSTSMHYTSKHRRPNPSSRTISSAGRSSKGPSQPGQVTPGAAVAGVVGTDADGDDCSSGSDSEADSESDGDEEEEEEDAEEVRRRAQADLEADAARAMHFGKVDEGEVEKMSAELRSEVRRLCAL